MLVELSFDPFATDTGSSVQGTVRKGATVRERFKAPIIKRAEKRTVTQVGPREYYVSGFDSEHQTKYKVYLDAGKWECDCYNMEHGDTRRRNKCSHVVAVLLYREADHTPPKIEGIQIPPRRGAGGSENRVDRRSLDDEGRSLPPAPSDERFRDKELGPLPDWVKELRPHQWQAAVDIYNAFVVDDVDIVWLDAPTGSGKTLIAELVRRMLDAPAFYICNTKTLQDQFHTDFPYSKVLKGRSNYPTLGMPYPDYTAADCTKEGSGDEAHCYWCPEVADCPYEMAKREALGSRLSILNTSYLLAEANYVGNTGGKNRRRLVISDEADVLESELMGFVQYELSERRLERLGITAPKKGVRKTTILAWLKDELLPAMIVHVKSIAYSQEIRFIREKNGYLQLIEDTKRIIGDLEQEIEALQGKEDEQDEVGVENWVRDNESGPLVLKPVRVNMYGQRMFWQHGEKWLCMSASFISTEEMNESLGVDEAGLRTATVTVPMMFDVRNRQVEVVPLANMTNKLKDTEWPKMVRGIDNICSWYPDVRILVHTVSYAFTEYLMKHCSREMRVRAVTYRTGKDRDDALARYRRTQGAILVAPSMDRGIDLKGDECRVVIVAKVPFPNLGDRQVGSRLRGIGGQAWYSVQTIRKLVQMTGRGVRSEDDYCNIYILDAQFLRKIWNKTKMLLPSWWREAVVIGRVKDYL